ncbi:hypothetical protein LTR36_002675 [Oleoguttula mirabilis]|uniref:Ankyrin n=1 Tax=Oleoguttula mirabilis TaxID=1507867 RepID=A0AAV9JKF6_9PEZI|nr:hypothetical protein LTR36_002675 [Oleoguttula mirabilis]
MGSWDRFTAFEFNDQIQRRGGIWSESIPWNSKPGRSISQDDYRPPSPVELPAAPLFQDATSSWSPPPSPTVRSRSSTLSRSPARSPRADSARVVDSPVMTPLTAREKNQLADKLYAAACAGDWDHIKLLLSLGAPIDAGTVVEGLYEAFKPSKSGRLSPLAGAATHRQTETVEFLLGCGAHLNPDINQSSSSPLHQAIKANDIDLARFLLELGADASILNCYKTTPIMYAVKYGSKDMVKLVLEFKPDLSQLTFIGAAAVHWAVWPDRPEILELLLQAGADCNHPMADGSTPLHCAATGGHLKTVECLLRYGADPVRRNEDWKTPLQVAEESEHPEIAQLLKDAALRR